MASRESFRLTQTQNQAKSSIPPQPFYSVAMSTRLPTGKEAWMSSCTVNSGGGIWPGLQQEVRDAQSSWFIGIWKCRGGMNFIFLLLKMGGREREERKKTLPCYLRKKTGNTQKKDELCIQRNESSIKNKLNPHSPLSRDDSASGVRVSRSCAASIHWRGRIHTLYSENLNGTQGTRGLTEYGFSYAHRPYAERVWLGI